MNVTDWQSFAYASLLVMIALSLGSFATVFAARFPKGESLWRPASHCPHCLKPVKAWYNIPVLGWLILGGRCSECKQAISVRYLLIESSFGVATLLVLWRFGLDSSLFYWLPVFWTLLLIAWVDWESSYIFNVTTYPLLGLGLASPWLWEGYRGAWWLPWVGAGALWLLMEGSYQVVKRWTGKEALGGGDIKLMAAMGAVLGPIPALRALAFVAVISLPYWVLTKKIKGLGSQDPFPFGPPLVAASLLSAWELLSGDLASWLNNAGLAWLAEFFLI